jgi:toluene monooxygenase system ferredoxin subunit
MTRKLVCLTADIPSNGMKECEAEGGLKLLVANSGEDYFAYQAVCPHQDVALCEGLYDGCVLTCHQHLWQWDIRTGGPIGLAEAPLEYYDVKVEDGSIYIVSPSALRLAELFAGISEATLERLIGIASSETLDAGATLYNVGDPADDVYVLESGRINFVIGREDRTTAAGFALRKGEVFGWNALLEHYPHRIAAASCLEKSTLLKINGKTMLQVLESDPGAGFLVMRRLSSLINRYLASSGAK